MGDFQKEGLTVQNPFCPTTVYLTKLLIFKTIHFSSLKNLHHRCFRDIIVSPCEENSCFENTLNIKMCDIREDKIYGFSGIPNRKCTQCWSQPSSSLHILHSPSELQNIDFVQGAHPSHQIVSLLQQCTMCTLFSTISAGCWRSDIS